MIRKAVLTITTASALFGQSVVQGPTVGWIYDAAAASLRPVTGIPGSSIMGRNLDLGYDLANAAIAPNGAFAIASAALDGRMLRVDLRSGNAAAIAEVPPSADEVIFSPSGAAAMLIYRSAAKALIIPNAADPRSAREVNFVEMPASFALADDGELMLAAGPQNLIAVDRSGNRWNVPFNGTPSSISFLNASHDALVTGATGLFVVRNITANAEARLLWEGDAVQSVLSPNRQSALVLTASQTLLEVNLESRASRTIECSCAPQLLARMSESVIRVTSSTDGPMWLLDWTSAEPRTVFVPADVKSEQ